MTHRHVPHGAGAAVMHDPGAAMSHAYGHVVSWASTGLSLAQVSEGHAPWWGPLIGAAAGAFAACYVAWSRRMERRDQLVADREQAEREYARQQEREGLARQVMALADELRLTRAASAAAAVVVGPSAPPPPAG